MFDETALLPPPGLENLQKLVKVKGRNLILASLCRKIAQKPFLSFHRAECVRPDPLMPYSNDAHTFLISEKKGWLDPHRRRNQLAVSAEEMCGKLVEQQVLIPGVGTTFAGSLRILSSLFTLGMQGTLR